MVQFVFADSAPIDDRKYFTDLYLQYEPIMYNTARKYIANSQAVEDIVQDSVEKLIKKIGTLRKLNSYTLLAYIVYTVRNTAFNHLRRENLKNHHIVSEEDVHLELFGHSNKTNPEFIFLNTEFSNETWRILGELPDKYMILLKGKYILGLDDTELADIIGCKAGSVRMYLTRARRSAIELLAKGELMHD